MHPTLLVVKRSQAIERIERAARVLASRGSVDPALVQALTSVGNNPQVRELRRLEAIADILDVALLEEAHQSLVTTVTSESLAEPVAQNVRNEEAAIAADEASELPPPSLVEEEAGPVKPSKRKGK